MVWRLPRFNNVLIISIQLWLALSQRAFKISSSACSISADASVCQVASAGDAALQIAFTAAAATSLSLDMSSATTCSASGAYCPQIFMVNSDHAENIVKLSKCAFYKQADYSTHLLTYTFMNVGGTAAFTVQDDHGIGRAVVPPGAMRECIRPRFTTEVGKARVFT
ncbi:unnamed protein product [Durusdinium trenchii]|uniref:Uncharacterized protein n=1 Tax=Durusdinium trenchii TaxID=1381693 RepID=A0ABP0R4Y8_9DINO